MAGSFGDWFGTLKTAFKIGKGSLDTSAMTAARTLTFRDLSGTVALTSDGGAVYSESAQTVTGSPQTVFTVPSYTPGSKTLAVYRNGLRLTLTSDYTETNSTTVTLTSAAAVGDDMLFSIGAPTGSFGTMATQNANAVVITGGTAALTGISTVSGAATTLFSATNTQNNGVSIRAISTSTTTDPIFSSNAAFRIQNTDTTANNFTGLDFFDATAVNARIAVINADHSTHIGHMIFVTRNGGTYAERSRITGAGRYLFNTTTDNGTDQVQVSGHIATVTAGNGFKTKEGSNAKQGTATLVAGAVTVSNTSVTANSRIFLTSQADGGTPGFLRVSARTAGTSFTITSSSGTDTSTVAYEIFEPA